MAEKEQDMSEIQMAEARAIADETGMTVEQVLRTMARMAAATPVEQDGEVSRVRKCIECGHRASVTVSPVDIESGLVAFACDECGTDQTFTAGLTNAERMALAKEVAI